MEQWSKSARESPNENTEENEVSFRYPFSRPYELVDAHDCRMSDNDELSIMSISNFKLKSQKQTHDKNENQETPIPGKSGMSLNNA